MGEKKVDQKKSYYGTINLNMNMFYTKSGKFVIQFFTFQCFHSASYYPYTLRDIVDIIRKSFLSGVTRIAFAGEKFHFSSSK